ncbi:MAG: hypothetical protein MRY64_04380 [Hyphomonadaceae bacterium]|nr:hypothetical protein [Hyphomonadaceae bacterium]
MAEDLKGKIQTVTGLIAPDALGPTLMHEHLLCDIRPPVYRDLETYGYDIPMEERWAIDYGEVDAPGNLILDNVDQAISEVRAMLAEGGRSIVDASCGGLNPDPTGLKAIAEATGANIILGCGYYVNDYQDEETAAKSQDTLTADMVGQIRDGAWGTSVRAGIIGEIGCQSPWTDLERRVMAAAIVAQQETGAAMTIHPGREADQPQEVVDFAGPAGADMSRFVISHIDRTIFDEDRLFRLADSGAVLEWDLFGQETSYYKWNEEVDMPNDALRLKALRKLIDRGHLDQILISQDICYRTRLKQCGGHGYGHIFRNVLPMMRRRGFSENEIQTIVVETPKRLLTFV